MQPVGLGVRIVAGIIDTVILGVVAYFIAIITGQTTDAGFELSGSPAFLAIIVYFAYFIVMEAMTGATLGKMIVGLRVVRVDGTAISWRESAIRNVPRIVDGFILYLVGIILIATSPKRQRLGDRPADTLVVAKGTVSARA